jgi:hypothetical protein
VSGNSDLAKRFAQLEKEVAAIKRFLKKLKTDAAPESDVA